MLARRAYLGAELPSDELAFTAAGVAVAGVLAGGMAEAAELRGGDLIEAIAGMRVRTLAELGGALRAAGARGSVELVALRGGVRVARDVAVVPHPGEPGATYGELAVPGATLRTIATDATRTIANVDAGRSDAARTIGRGDAAGADRGNHAASDRDAATVDDGPRATRAGHGRGTIVIVQGIACESIDRADAPLAQLAAGWTRAGWATLRMDKRGVGDSTGAPCASVDFATELADFTALVASAPRPVVGFGHSVGGIIATQLPLDRIIVYGAPVTRWLACLVDTTRRQLAMRGAPAEQIDRAVADLEARAAREGLNGRSAAYHAQLDALDLEAAWRAVTAPVFVLRGEHDWVVRADDQARIAELAREATLVDLPGLDHMLGRHADREASFADYGNGTFDPAIVAATLEWLDRTA